MGFRMRKSINLGGGVRLNLSKKGIGYSVGTKGFRVTKKARGGIRTTASIPGTGISFVSDTKKKRTTKKRKPAAASSTRRYTSTVAPSVPTVAAKKNGLSAADLRDPQKALVKYQNCLRNRMTLMAVFVIVCAVFALAGQQVLSVISLLLAVVVYACKGTWEKNVQDLEKILSSRDGEDGQINETGEAEKVAELAPEREQTPKKSASQSANFHVAGVRFHEKEIEELGQENSDYDLSRSEIQDAGMENERIYRLEFDDMPVELVPEPENPEDPKAIKVVVGGTHVGYIKKGSTSRVRNLLAAGGKVTAEIQGGEYKILYSDDEDGQEKLSLQKDTAPYSVIVSITQ